MIYKLISQCHRGIYGMRIESNEWRRSIEMIHNVIDSIENGRNHEILNDKKKNLTN